jgi:hypothetical protein
MKKIYLLVVTSIMFGVVMSCKEQQVIPEVNSSQISNAVKIEEGRIKFNSWDEMKALLKSTEKKSPQQLNEMIGDSFKSHFEIEGQIEQVSVETLNENKLDLKDTPISEPYYASLLNKDREIEVGDDIIYKIGNDYCFQYHKSDANLVQKFYDDLKNSASIVETGEFKHFYNQKLGVFATVISKKTGFLTDSKVNKSSKIAGADDYYYFSPRLRMRSEYYTHSYLGYGTIGVQTEMEQYGTVYLFFNGWKSDYANKISVKLLDGTYSLSYLGFNSLFGAGSGYAEAYNNCESYIRVNYFVGAFPNFTWQSGHAEHFVQYGPLSHTIYSSY